MSLPTDAGAGGMPSMPSMDSTPFRATIGPLLIGGLVSAVLYGITATQTYVYYQNSIADRWFLKLTVGVLCFFDTLDIVLNSHVLYHYLVVNFLNPLALSVPSWSILLHVLVTSVSNVIVRGAFTARVWRMSDKNWLLCGVITLASLGELICAVVITTRAWKMTFFELASLNAWVYANFIAMLVADILIASALVYFLHVSRTGIKRTEGLINLLITYTVNTGVLTVANSTAGLVLFLIMTDNLVYIAFYLQLSKLYVNAYLATLNARENLRKGASQVNEHVSINLSQFSHARSMPYNGSGGSGEETPMSDKRPGPLSITVTTQVDEMMDDDMKQRRGWAGPPTA